MKHSHRFRVDTPERTPELEAMVAEYVERAAREWPERSGETATLGSAIAGMQREAEIAREREAMLMKKKRIRVRVRA